MRILIDSSIILETLKGNNKAVEIFEMLMTHDLFAAPVVFDEVIYVVRKRNIKRVKDVIVFLFTYFSFLSIDENIIRIAASMILKYNLKPADALILATCKYHNIKYLATLDDDFIKPAKKENIHLIASKEDVEKI